MRSLISLLQRNSFTIALALTAACGLAVPSSAQVINADATGAGDGAVAQAQYTTSGSYFSRELGTPLRFSYHSEGYGTEVGVVSIGTMKVFNLDGATWFLDGQGTMSDGFGGGFNAGIGYRELVNFGRGDDPDRVLGASFWTDGQNTKADNFFTQLGVSLESLGEAYDWRLNGYFPLERTKVGDPTLIDTNTVTYSGNELFAGLEQVTTDTAHSVVDIEGARRLGNLDAWAILGAYHLGGGDADDAGFRAGFRGYALPDLMVGVQVTDDDIYHTNVMASLTWFVGRTHTGNAPIGAIVDRFRDPVWRNDYITTTSVAAVVGTGNALTDEFTDELFNIIHVNSNAGAGGDGTFENPFQTLEEAEAAQQEGAIVLVHSGSTLAPTNEFTFLNNVRLFGEGLDQNGDTIVHTVDPVGLNPIDLPETRAGAFMDPMYVLDASGVANVFVLAENNTIDGGTINNGTDIIDATGAVAPNLAHLNIGGTNGPSGTAINFTNVTGTATVANTVRIKGAGTGILIDGSNGGMNIAADILNSDGSSLIVRNRTGGVIAYSGSIIDTDGGTDIDGDMVNDADIDTAHAIIFENNTGNTALNFTQALDTADNEGINITAGDFSVLFMDNNGETTDVTFADLFASSNNANTIHFVDGGDLIINDSANNSRIVNTGSGDAFHNVGSGTDASTITIAADIRNIGDGNAVDISGHTEGNITFSGEIRDGFLLPADASDALSDGIVLSGNSGGIIAFNGQVTTRTSGGGNGVTISGGSGTVQYQFTNVDITTTTGTGFSMTGGGTITVVPAAGETNTITTTSGQALVMDGMGAADPLTVGTGGVNFDRVNTTAGTGNSIFLRDVEGTGLVDIGSGTNPGDGGTITNTGAGDDAVVIDNANNVAITRLTINKGAAAGNALVIQGQDGGTVSTNGLKTTTSSGTGIVSQNNTGGTNTFTNSDIDVTGAGNGVTLATNPGATNSFDGFDIDVASGTGFAASGGGVVVATTSGTNTNTVTSTTGTAINIDGVTTTASGINFTSATKSGGAGSGVIVRNVTGGQVAINGTGVTAASGGSITSTDSDAIVLENVENVDIRNMRIVSAGGEGLNIDHTAAATTGMDVTITNLDLDASTGAGINVLAAHNTSRFNMRLTNSDLEEAVTMSNTAAGGFGLLLDSNEIDTTGTDVAFTLGFSGSAADGDVTLRNMNVIRSQNASAFSFTANNTNADVEFRMDNNTLQNNSASATASFLVNGGATLDADIVNNSIDNQGAGDGLVMTSDGTTSRINLNLINNGPNGEDYELITMNQGTPMVDFNFGVVDRDDVDANNPADVTYNPGMDETLFEDIDAVEAPTVPF